MKINRAYVFITVSSLALLVVLVIQVNWILSAAQMKEQIFNEKANLVLAKTAEAFDSDTAGFRQMNIYPGSAEKKKLDSLLSHYMRVYNISLNYFFELKHNSAPRPSDTAQRGEPLPLYQKASFQTCIGADSEGRGLDLKLVFPEREEFILAEMGLPFVVSVALLLIVMIISWRTAVSLLREKELSEQTTDFLNNMTHEFKTPLTNIALATRMIVKDANIGDEEKVKHYSGIVLEENEKLRWQVEHVLSMNALERGEIPLRKEAVDLHQLIRDCLKSFDLQLENLKGKIATGLMAEHFKIEGDKTHLSNALRNIIDNAMKYAVDSPDIHVTTCNSGNEVLIAISDKGIGIDEAHQQKVFAKFYRVPTGDVHDVKGFGLGLTYAKKIIELHGGSISLQSEKGVGTTFNISLKYV